MVQRSGKSSARVPQSDILGWLQKFHPVGFLPATKLIFLDPSNLSPAFQSTVDFALSAPTSLHTELRQLSVANKVLARRVATRRPIVPRDG